MLTPNAFFQADCHFRRQRSLLVQKTRQRHPVNAESLGGILHRKAKRFYDPYTDKLTGMQRVGRYRVKLRTTLNPAPSSEASFSEGSGQRY